MISQQCTVKLMPEGGQRFDSSEGLGAGLYEHVTAGPAEQVAAAAGAAFNAQPLNPSLPNGMLPTSTAINQLEQVLSFINAHKVSQPRTLVSGPGSVKSSGGSSSQSGREVKWVQPSGPRRPGEGVENEEQGIVVAEQPAAGTVVVRITLLAAGFIIGPSGSTVRDIMRISGADIKSWTEQASSRSRRPCRVFVLEGEDPDILAALTIINAAVQRYKELCEGRCCGQAVGRVQRIMGVEFSYQPPPKNVVPYAAALKGHIQRPLRMQSSPFDIHSLMQQQQQPQPFMLVGGTNGSPYFAPYSNVFGPPASPPMLPYGAMYGLAMPATHCGASSATAGGGGSSGTEGDNNPLGVGSIMCGYDYSQGAGGGVAEPGNPGLGMYPGAGFMYPTSPTGNGGGGHAPPSPTPGWVMGSGPGVMLPNGIMLPPPSPVRYRGMPSTAAAVMPVPMPMPLGLHEPIMGQGTPMAASELSWPLGGMHSQHAPHGSAASGASGKAPSAASEPASLGAMSPSEPSGGSGGSGDRSGGGVSYDAFMAPAPPGAMYGQQMATWYGSNSAGMLYPQPPGQAATPPSPYSQLMTMMPIPQPVPASLSGPNSPSRGMGYGRPHSASAASRLNPRAAPWGSPPGQGQGQGQRSRDQQLQQRESPRQQHQGAQAPPHGHQSHSHTPPEQGQPREQAKHQHQFGPHPHPRPRPGLQVQVSEVQVVPQQQQAGDKQGMSSGSGGGGGGGSGGAVTEPGMEQQALTVTPPAGAAASNKESWDRDSPSPPAPAEPPAFLAKTPRRPAPGSGNRGSETRPAPIYASPLDIPQPHGLHTPPPHLHQPFPQASSVPSNAGSGNVSVSGGMGTPSISTPLPSCAPGVAGGAPPAGGMVSPADPLISPSRFSGNAKAHHGGFAALPGSRHRQPDFNVALDTEGLSPQLRVHLSNSKQHLLDTPTPVEGQRPRRVGSAPGSETGTSPTLHTLDSEVVSAEAEGQVA